MVKNPGKSKLIINQINTGCGCTKASVEKNTLEPEDSCSLNFTFNPRDKHGKQEEYVIITANTDSLIHILQINAFVR